MHATHLTDDDIAALGGTGTAVCACPSTEADLADGVGPFRRLRDAGSPLCLGSDQHAVTDLLAEARAGRGARAAGHAASAAASARPSWSTPLTVAGHRALGWPDAGRIAAGRSGPTWSPSGWTARAPPAAAPGQLVMAAGAADVHTVVVDGRVVVADGQHVLGDVGRLLAAAIEPLWEDA